MRTENQIKRKLNEMNMQRKTLLSRLEEPDVQENEAERKSIESQITRLDELIGLLEWVLNAPEGNYHQ